MTAALVAGRDVVGMPVVDRSTGDDLASVRDLVFEPVSGRLEGFTLTKRGFWRGKMRQVLPVAGVVSIGTDAVLVADREALVDPSDAASEVASPDHGHDVLNDLVVTESGRQLGNVVDVVIVGGASPRVVGLRIAGGSVGDGLIPLAAHAGISGSALVVPDDYEARVRTDLTGLAGELADLRRDE